MMIKQSPVYLRFRGLNYSVFWLVVFLFLSDDIDEKRAKELGIKGFLMKPLNRKKLAETVLKLLDTSK
jgi:PleD family two-component response regulator